MCNMDWNLEQIKRITKASYSMTPTIKKHLKQLDKKTKKMHIWCYATLTIAEGRKLDPLIWQATTCFWLQKGNT